MSHRPVVRVADGFDMWGRRLVFPGALLLMAGAAACSGGDKKAAVQPTADPAATEAPRLVSAAGALRQASEASQQVQTLHAAFTMTIDSRRGAEYFAGEIMMQSPDRMYMISVFGDQQHEVLLTVPDMYARSSTYDWARIDSEQVGIDPQAFLEYHEDNGLIDLDYLANYLENSQRMADEVMDGKTQEHYWGGFDYAIVLDGIDEEDIVTCPGLASLKGSTGDVRVDTWIDAETRLPRRVIVDMDVNVPALNDYLGIKVTMDFLQFNGPVAIPEPPVGAPLLSDTVQQT